MSHQSIFGIQSVGQSEHNFAFDVLKCFAALFVVYFHCFVLRFDGDIFSTVAQVMNALERVAVPIFFMITGFYYRQMVKCRRIKLQLIKILLIAIFGTIFYFVVELILHITQGDVGQWLLSCFTLSGFIHFITTNSISNIVLFAFHLWYLFAIFYVLIIFLLLDKLNLYYKVLPFIGLLVIGGICLNYFDFHILNRNFLFFGIPFVAAGRGIYEYRHKLLSLRNSIISCGIVLSVVFIVAEYLFLSTIFEFPIRDYYTFTLPLTACLILFALKYPNFGKDSICAYIGRRYSAHIYVFHFFVYIVFRQLGITPPNNYFYPLVIFIVTTIFSIAFVQVYKSVGKLINNTISYKKQIL